MTCRAGHLRGAASVAVFTSPVISARQVIAECLAEHWRDTSRSSPGGPLSGGAAYEIADMVLEWLEASAWSVRPAPENPASHECDCFDGGHDERS